ncbi:MAG: HAD family hydrolase [Candidatus Omnitrophota bacterium]
MKWSEPKNVLRCEAVIFDIDNVLIDTQRSYLEAIRQTVDIYLTEGTVPLFRPTRSKGSLTLLSENDVNQFKLLGGFNDDWDCCYGILQYLLALPVHKRTMEELKRLMDFKQLARETKNRPLGVAGIIRKFGRSTAVKIEKIARIFQEIYLGHRLFPIVEKNHPQYWNKLGFIQRERLIFKKKILEKLKKNGLALGIATGRSRFEASYGLQKFGIAHFFDAITHADDVKKAEREAKQSLRKPHPYSILKTAKKLGEGKVFFYVGDLPDDILAANRSKESLRIYSVAFPAYSATGPAAFREIEKAQPDFIIQKPRELVPLALSKLSQ